jgi:hypothetical protein
MSALRDLGNEHFKAGKFKEAEQLYTEAYHLSSAPPGMHVLMFTGYCRIPGTILKSLQTVPSLEYDLMTGWVPSAMLANPSSSMDPRTMQR